MVLEPILHFEDELRLSVGKAVEQTARWKQQNLLLSVAKWTETSEPKSVHSECKCHREADTEKSFSGGNSVH